MVNQSNLYFFMAILLMTNQFGISTGQATSLSIDLGTICYRSKVDLVLVSPQATKRPVLQTNLKSGGDGWQHERFQMKLPGTRRMDGV